MNNNEVKNCDELDEGRYRSNSNNSNSSRTRREVDPSVYDDTLLRPPNGILTNSKDRLGVPERSASLRLPNRGGSLGRKAGVVNSSRLPIQHELRFPGSNFGPPQFPVLNSRKRSVSVPEGLSHIGWPHQRKNIQSPLLSSNVSC